MNKHKALIIILVICGLIEIMLHTFKESGSSKLSEVLRSINEKEVKQNNKKKDKDH